MIFGDKMCNGGTPLHRPMVEPFSFSTLHFLRSYNRIFSPTELAQCYNLALLKDSRGDRGLPPLPLTTLPLPPIIPASHQTDQKSQLLQNEIKEPMSSLNYENRKSPTKIVSSTCRSTPVDTPDINHFSYESNGLSIDGSFSNSFLRRQRGEKRPIPDEQKDEKYYERRKRNNEAAKKSRDARKMREDRIAFRAAMLEQENAILRAQTVALREELSTLRQMMCTRTNSQISV